MPDVNIMLPAIMDVGRFGFLNWRLPDILSSKCPLKLILASKAYNPTRTHWTEVHLY